MSVQYLGYCFEKPAFFRNFGESDFDDAAHVGLIHGCRQHCGYPHRTVNAVFYVGNTGVSPGQFRSQFRLAQGNVAKEIGPDLCADPFTVRIADNSGFRRFDEVREIAVRYAFRRTSAQKWDVFQPEVGHIRRRKVYPFLLYQQHSHNGVVGIVVARKTIGISIPPGTLPAEIGTVFFGKPRQSPDIIRYLFVTETIQELPQSRPAAPPQGVCPAGSLRTVLTTHRQCDPVVWPPMR